jgi:hypothetical protein
MSARVVELAARANAPGDVRQGVGDATLPPVAVGGTLVMVAGCTGGKLVTVAVGRYKMSAYCPPKGVVGAADDTIDDVPAAMLPVTITAAPGVRWWVVGFTWTV